MDIVANRSLKKLWFSFKLRPNLPFAVFFKIQFYVQRGAIRTIILLPVRCLNYQNIWIAKVMKAH